MLTALTQARDGGPRLRVSAWTRQILRA